MTHHPGKMTMEERVRKFCDDNDFSNELVLDLYIPLLDLLHQVANESREEALEEATRALENYAWERDEGRGLTYFAIQDAASTVFRLKSTGNTADRKDGGK